MTESDIVWRCGPDLTATELHDLLQLRVDVFVVEQECAYPELDGRDLLETTWHAWIGEVEGPGGGGPVAYLRLLFDHDPPQIGRVVTRPSHRGGGRTEPLLAAAHERAGAAGSFLEAQSHLAGWYERQGWRVSGPEFVEDGIPHVPMHRPAHL